MWWNWLPEALILFLPLALEGRRRWVAQASHTSPPIYHSWTSERKIAARERTRELWYHGFDSYMRYAFPMDELTPLSCSGQGPDWDNPGNTARNDVAGNFSLTLIDVLDTFVILDDPRGFERAVKDVVQTVSFSSSVKPQVFETTIRILGGLLSAHQFAHKPNTSFHIPWYQGELLDLAHDLGTRLLVAFNTPTGLPFARVNLQHGIMKGETSETCSAGAGSLMLEFATLSRLTGDPRFETAARKAFFALWNRKSPKGLIGNTINILTGDWNMPEVTGIGAGIDSFYEYALKWYILSGDPEFLEVWDDAYAAIMRYSRAIDGSWYRPVYMRSGDAAYYTMDSLAAFWPGLQVLAGDVEAAIKLHLLYYNIWRKHSGLPEVYDTHSKIATSHQYPLRPEFVESTWYLYRATKDPFYLDVAERILFDITTRAKVGCGIAGISDLRTNKRDDRMESFTLSETLKYLYLLFDEENPLHSDDTNYVFTTEGHILTNENPSPLPPASKKIAVSQHQCPAYQTIYSASVPHSGPMVAPSIRLRYDYDYARELVGQSASESDQGSWSPYGWCAKPAVDIYGFDVVLSSNGQTVAEDLSPSRLKIAPVDGGYIVHDVNGIRTHIVKRLDGKGFDIRKMGHYTIRTGNLVYVNDSTLFGAKESSTPQGPREAEVTLNFFLESADDSSKDQIPLQRESAPSLNDLQLTTQAFTAMFGADLSSSVVPSVPFSRQETLALYWEDSNLLGCDPFMASNIQGAAVVYRGHCTFLEKLFHAKQAGAHGVLVLSDSDTLISPSSSAEELDVVGDVSDVFLLILPSSDGEKLKELMNQGTKLGLGQTFVKLIRDLPSEVGNSAGQTKPDRYLYLNGYPLLNTRLVV